MLHHKQATQEPNTITPLWMQHESIAFECAQEAIVNLMSIYSAEIAAEESKTTTNLNRLKKLNELVSHLDEEYSDIRWDQHDRIARIHREYTSKVFYYNQGKSIEL